MKLLDNSNSGRLYAVKLITNKKWHCKKSVQYKEIDIFKFFS